jgi:hypothetical protein
VTRPRILWRQALVLALTAVAAVGAGAAGATGGAHTAPIDQPRTLVAIVNRSRPETGLTRKELIQIYRGEIRYWPANRQLIQLALPPGTSGARNDFIRTILQMSPSEFDREWRSKRFRGESAIIPNPDLSRAEVMQAVATQGHFIAIVELEWLRGIDIRFTRDVKILAIDGARPDDADYPLRLSLASGSPVGLAAAGPQP